jgi:predicted GIY-YIG superfamily endonuclease
MSMSAYSKFTIYKIYLIKDPSICYVGSTINFSRRKSQHKKNCTNRRSKKYNYPLYQFIRSMNGWNEFIMEIIETISCNTKEEGLEREKELIRVHNAKININKPI